MRTIRGLILSVVGAGAVLSLTLWPSPGESLQSLDFWCLVCGSRGLADALLNIGLFVPFGAGISVLRGPIWGVLGAAVLSGGIEIVQEGLPGRFPSFGDLVWNTTGGALGALLVVGLPHLRRALLDPPSWLKTLGVSFPLVVFAATCILVSPQYPDGEYYGQWTRDLGSLTRYQGEVVSARLGGLEIPDRRLRGSSRFRERLLDGDSITFSFRVSAPPGRRTHLLAIFDHRQTEVFLVTVEREDLLFQRRTKSAALRLEEPFLRWPGGVSHPPGTILDVAVWEEPTQICVRIGRQRRCDLPAGVEGGWRLLHRMGGAARWEALLFSLIWMAVLSIPAGLATERMLSATFAGIGIGVLGVLASWLGPFMAPHPLTFLSPPVGALVGFALAGAWGYRSRPSNLDRKPARDS